MSLHGNPQCAASAFALHLEQAYGLQLDPYRHKQLVAELEEYAGRADEPGCPTCGSTCATCDEFNDSTDEPAPSDPAESDESYEASEALQAVPRFGVSFEFTRPSAEVKTEGVASADPAFKGLFIPPTLDAGNYKEETADAV